MTTHDARWLALTRRAKVLSWVTLAWLGLEGTAGIVAGILAGSIALVGFGIDSAIEAIASIIVVWRFTGKRTLSETAERRAQKLVAISFFLLAPYVAIEAIRTLIGGEHPDTSYIGIALSVGAILTMIPLGLAKKRLGEQLGHVPPQVRAHRIFSVLTSPSPYSSGCSPIPYSVSGG